MQSRHLLNARNEMWSVVMRCPLSLMWFMAPWRVFRQLVFAIGQGWSWARREPRWWLDALRGLPHALRSRRAVSTRSYWHWLRLARRPAYDVDDLRSRFGIFAGKAVRNPLPKNPKIAIMITTRNRREDLYRTLTELSTLDPPPSEILVTADGCTDGTVAMVQQEFPAVTLLTNETSQGSVPSRDRMIRQSNADLVLSLDDDSYPIEKGVMAKLPELFVMRPDVAVVTFSELRDGGIYSTGLKTPLKTGHYVSAYPNCAALMRRDVYLNVSGFAPYFVHMYEEPDYALQCYGKGHAVWFEPSITIRHHLTQANRSSFQAHQLNARNELWSVWLRCPWPWLPIVSMYRIWRQFRYACTQGFSWAVREPIYWWNSLKGLPACMRQRKPIPWSIYYRWMRLARHPRFAPTAFRAPLFNNDDTLTANTQPQPRARASS
jgi:GT2 family glycosyltransferase